MMKSKVQYMRTKLLTTADESDQEGFDCLWFYGIKGAVELNLLSENVEFVKNVS